MKIIIVEDEIITATDLKTILEKKGYTVLAICKTYDEILVALESDTPDLMLIDIKLRLSSRDGVEIAESINQNNNIPVIFLTSQTDHRTFERAKNLQPAAYLFKPFRHGELVYQIELAYQHYLVNKSFPSSPATSESIFFPYHKGLRKVVKSKILLIKAEGSYVNIYVDEEPPLLFTMNIGYIHQFFPTSNFFKLGRSYIVNLDKIERIDSEYIYFENSEISVHIPQSQKKLFLSQLALTKTPQKN
jgi:DNA-binding LytR/AlgR family response regulator